MAAAALTAALAACSHPAPPPPASPGQEAYRAGYAWRAAHGDLACDRHVPMLPADLAGAWVTGCLDAARITGGL